MKIPIVLDIDINPKEWADAIGFRVENGFVIGEGGKFSIEDFEENIREYIRITWYLIDPNGLWLKEKFFSDEGEQEAFLDSLFDNFDNEIDTEY